MVKELPTVEVIIDNPKMFNQWLINNGGLEIFIKNVKAVPPKNGKYYLSQCFEGELWLCYASFRGLKPNGTKTYAKELELSSKKR